MYDYININNAFFLLVGGIIWHLVKKYFDSYTTEKGKNLATKEDIGAITTEIEKRKNLATKEDIGAITTEIEKRKNLATKEDIGAITTEIENVKVAIQTFGQLKTEYEQQRREVLLSFYDTAVEMLYDKLAVHFGDLPFDEGKSLFEYQQHFRVIISLLLKKYQRIVLYFEHKSAIQSHAEKVLLAGLDAHKIMNKRFADIKITYAEREAAYRTEDKQHTQEANKEADKADKAFWDEMLPVVEVFKNSLSRYLTDVNKFLREGD